MAITWTDDNDSINTCEAKGDWTGTNFSDPDDNSSGSATPIYREGTGCMQATAKGNTEGNWDDTINIDLTDKALVVWLWLSGPTEIGYFTYFEIEVQDGGAYIRYDYLPEITTIGNGGWFPCVLWPTDDGSAFIDASGTVVISGIDGMALRANNNQGTDAKLVGWDYIHALGLIGAAGDTVTLEDFVLRDAAQNFGVITQKGTTFQAQNNLRYGGTGTTNVNEANKTLTFRGANSDHGIGFIYDSGGTAINITYADMVFNWQYNESGDVFVYTATPALHKFDGCQFNNHPDLELPAHSADRWQKNCKYNDGKEVNFGNLVFENNTISNKLSGVHYLGDGIRRAKNNIYKDNTDAMRFTTGQVLTLDGDAFDGNTYDIHFDSPTINTLTSYSETNQSSGVNLDSTNKRLSQSGWPNPSAGLISHAIFYLKKTGSPTGNVYAKLYSGGTPFGPPVTVIATSEPIAASAIGTGYALHTFEFKDGISMTSPGVYSISVEYEDGDASNYVTVGVDSTSPSHPATAYLYTTSWASQTYDLCHYVYNGGLLYITATNGANPSAAKVKITGTNPTPLVAISNPIIHKLIGVKENSEVSYTEKPTASDSGTAGASAAGSRTFTDSTKSWTTNQHKGRLLIIEEGADAGRYYIASNTATTLKLDAELGATASSLDYSIYAGFTVIAHDENVPSDGEFEYSYNYAADRLVDILIFHVNYESIELIDVLLGASNQTIPIGQVLDVNYFNPS